MYSIPEGTNAFGGGWSGEEYYYGGYFSAFEGHFQFSSLIVPNSVTELNMWAFLNCHSLRTITLPSTMRALGYQPFYGCDSLTSMTCLASVPPIKVDTAKIAEKLDTVRVAASSVAAYKAAAGWKDLTIVAL
ncbi:MAG TPA: leucine-rich repeat protein [Paludibacteraceae bacterium]|nr:leucine-rich repeat protein [Paludibacteraceae bacterium]